jgi:tetratricopeptide (TPR) repeat protein
MKADKGQNPTTRITELLRLIKNRTNDSDLHQELGKAYRENGQPSAALKAFKKAIDINPSDPWNWMFLGNIYFWRAEYKQALAAFEHARSLDPGISFVYICMADTYHGLGQHEQADAYYRKAIEVAPDDELAIDNLRRWESIVARGAYNEKKT